MSKKAEGFSLRFVLINTGNISRKVLSKVLRSFDKNFERLQSKKSIIQIPGQKNAKNELEKIQAIGKERMKHMKETEQRIIQKWIECLEDNASLEAQQAYCQGYIDCLFLLCGMGIIEKDSVANDIFEQLNK